MLLLAAIVVIAFFIYFQPGNAERNRKKFEKSRKRYDQVLELLRKIDEEEKMQSKKNT